MGTVEAGTEPTLRAPALVGRQRERALLATALASPPSVVIVEGEAGVGKSRLVREVVASTAHAATALVACCPPVPAPYTLGAVVDALRQAVADPAGLGSSPLLGALRPLFPEWSGQLPPALEPAADPTAARHRLFRALIELLDTLAVGTFVVEDVHWADEATIEFLLVLASANYRPVNLLVTCRPNEVPERSLLPRLSRLAAGSSGLRLALAPLDRAATGELVSSMLGGRTVSEAFADFLHSGTDGLPLAVEETVKLLTDRADLARRDGEWIRRHLDQIPLPASVRDVVLERAGRLGADATQVLHAVGVLSTAADRQLIGTVAGLAGPALQSGLSGALASGLVAADDKGRLTFRHALAERAVYESIPLPQRQLLHARAGAALESQQPPPLPSLARHFRAAGETAKWCEYGERAVDLALLTGDESTAMEIVHQLVTTADLPPVDVARLTGKFPFFAMQSKQLWADLVAALRATLSTGALEPGDEALVRSRLGRVLMAMYQYDEGRAQLERALPDLRDPLQAAKTMIMLGWPSDDRLPAEEHLRWLHRAEQAAAEFDPRERLGIAVDRVTALLMLGQSAGWTEAARLPDEAAVPGGLPDVVRANFNIGDQALMWGRYDDARRYLDAAEHTAHANELVALGDLISTTRLRYDWFTGAWAGLDERARALSANPDLPEAIRLEARLVVALLAVATEATDRAELALRAVLADLVAQKVPSIACEAAGALGRLLLRNGDADEALTVTEPSVETIVRKGVWLWSNDVVSVRVDALATVGRLDEAAELVDRLGRGLADLDAPAPHAGLLTARAVLAERTSGPAAGAPEFAGVAAAWRALPRPYAALLAAERAGGCLLRSGRRDDGVDRLTEVHGGLADLGAATDASRVARTLRAAGVAIAGHGWRGGRQGYGDQLSPREADVVRLVVEGRTNREIAATLYRSPNTVATQLRSAMRKLGVSSRAALAARATHDQIAAEAESAAGERPRQ